jgi:hypothetical protein
MDSLFRLRRFLDSPPGHRPAACELCGAPIESKHSHVVDLEQRRLMCTCRPCYLLFTHSGAAGGKLRSVSQRVLKLPHPVLGDPCWDAFNIPVGVAFFLRDSARGRVLAFYPSPAGATESGLPLETWKEMAEVHPLIGTLEADTEALLVSRRRDRVDAWIVPVDACYELVGRVRSRWKGFDGGGEAWHEIDAFFAGLAERGGSLA